MALIRSTTRCTYLAGPRPSRGGGVGHNVATWPLRATAETTRKGRGLPGSFRRGPRPPRPKRVGRSSTLRLATAPIARGARVLLGSVTEIAATLRPDRPILRAVLNGLPRLLATGEVAEPDGVARESMATMGTATVAPAPLMGVTRPIKTIGRA